MSERDLRELDIQVEVDTGVPDIEMSTDGGNDGISIAVDGAFRPSDYEHLSNKPQINEVELFGSMDNADLRIVLSNTREAWDEDVWFIPKAGQIVLYTDYYGTDKPAVKIGDGNAFLIDLPVAGEGLAERVSAALSGHAADMNLHVSNAKRAFWDNKLNYEVAGEELKFTRN